MSPAELFALPFMQRALIAALLTGLAAPAIGTFLVQRRLALMGDGIEAVDLPAPAILKQSMCITRTPTAAACPHPGVRVLRPHPLVYEMQRGEG